MNKPYLRPIINKNKQDKYMLVLAIFGGIIVLAMMYAIIILFKNYIK